ncbi:MAG TPA: hypothetical protein VJY34_14300 [Roseiarcus sp.]|nr:hypothetical protein [Roseiarcus sp.]
MLTWLRRRREQAERIEAEADALISDLGNGAYAEARRRAHEASSDEMEREWSRVALAIARKTGRRVGVDTETRMAIDADFSHGEDRAAPSEREPPDDADPLDELMRIVSETPSRPPYRIQFIGGGTERGTSVPKEVRLNASDPSEAIREASRLCWPPRAIGFQLIDREGREAFGRDRR